MVIVELLLYLKVVIYVNPSDWYIYPIQPQALLGSYGYAKDAIWTGNHYILPNYGEEGITVGKDLFHLNAWKGPFRQCPGIVNKGEDYVVALTYSNYYPLLCI